MITLILGRYAKDWRNLRIGEGTTTNVAADL
jgi:hypothetical protein